LLFCQVTPDTKLDELTLVITTDFQTILHEVSEYDLTTPEDILDKVCSYFNLTWYDIETTLPIQIKER
jgi:hypothetical protein